MRKLSSAEWIRSFPGSSYIYDLKFPFNLSVEKFIFALRESGARVDISATLRPPERAYLMHWCWMIAHNKIAPEKVPPLVGVNINWVHEYNAKSISAAKAMVSAYGMNNLYVAPALNSRHTEGHAIDMNISWKGELIIQRATGEFITIKSAPPTGMNTELHKVGKSYGVIKYHGGWKDAPHWSIDGR